MQSFLSFVFDRRDWVALMVDVDPAQLRSCVCDFPARFYVRPADYLPEGRPVQQCLVSIPGKHRNADGAWQAIHDLIGDSVRVLIPSCRATSDRRALP